MRSYPVELSVREAQLVVSGLTTLLRELEQRESGLVELCDSDDVSLAAAAAPYRLDQLGAIQAEVALLQERLIDAVHLADVPGEGWPEELGGP
ncbi:Uncharacterised protein [Actinomyces bovis]|uniref:Uncharacterized protein n=1 Tax=Actinomyces bovis TaxID=1658 RepID=A0ABY1VNC3_9ACTO|nr:Uncharacterised protein [Actinomyces bovis]VEG55403.1 Uncharacterised protein [Actinomyces israelii]